jgi:hypothetical protein
MAVEYDAMHRFLCILLCVPLLTMGNPLLPVLEMGSGQSPDIQSTWAHAGSNAVFQVRALETNRLNCDIYQIDGRITIPISRKVPLADLNPGINRLEIPLPETSLRGKLLIKIHNSSTNKPIADLTVDILPKDALESLIRQSKAGRVWIDPAFKVFHSWAASHGISSTRPSSANPVSFHFGKPMGAPEVRPPCRVMIFEREQPDAFPVVEINSISGFTKILLPPGFLDMLPTSATAEAFLLRQLHLLP